MRKNTWGKTIAKSSKETNEEHFVSCSGLGRLNQEAVIGYWKTVGYQLVHDWFDRTCLTGHILRYLTKMSGRMFFPYCTRMTLLHVSAGLVPNHNINT